jgi:hypothetical protein
VLSGSLLEAALALEAPPGGELTLAQLDQLVASLGAELTAQVIRDCPTRLILTFNLLLEF